MVLYTCTMVHVYHLVTIWYAIHVYVHYLKNDLYVPWYHGTTPIRTHVRTGTIGTIRWYHLLAMVHVYHGGTTGSAYVHVYV